MDNSSSYEETIEKFALKLHYYINSDKCNLESWFSNDKDYVRKSIGQISTIFNKPYPVVDYDIEQWLQKFDLIKDYSDGHS